MKKRNLTAILLFGAMILSACTSSANTSSATSSTTITQNPQDSDKLSIVATSFHEYDWVTNIIGDNNDTFDITLLMDNGVDLHSYEPNVEDISIISSADLFIYNGGASHGWVSGILAEPMNEDLQSIEVMASLGEAVKAEVTVEGMQSGSHDHSHDESNTHDHDESDSHDHDESDSHDHDDSDTHDHDDSDTHDHDESDSHDHDESDTHEPHSDEHVWLSLNNAMTICEIIEEKISDMDPDNAAMYQANTDAYINSLKELDNFFRETIDTSPRDTLVFADRFPFLYLMQDYDIQYFAAFQGCSAETEANFETIAFLTEKVNELDVNNLLILENGLLELAQTINNSSEDKDSDILELDSMQSVSSEDIASGVTYYSIMESNLEILKTALGE